REEIAKYETKDLYSSKRSFLAEEITNQITPILMQRGLIVENVLLRNLTLPDQVRTAIETKLQAEQQSQQMEFVLTKERQEAERKVIEAEGIKKSQEIINKTLTKEYLQYLWISKINDNQHVFYVPIDSQGVTLFRNVDDVN
ncbi:MAG: SPFH domain-containing protein, partial [archaeon]